MGDKDIIDALQKGVTAAVAASNNTALPVKYLEVNFDKPDDGKWLEIVWIPNNDQGATWGDKVNYRGLLRLILHWPNNSGGIYAPLTLLGSVADYFHKGRLLSGVQIYEKADFTGALPEGNETLYPVSIRYQSYRS